MSRFCNTALRKSKHNRQWLAFYVSQVQKKVEISPAELNLQFRSKEIESSQAMVGC